MADETTDLTLFVRNSAEEITRWNRQRIVDALIRETQINEIEAEEISKDVEKQIVSSGISLLTVSLIRELVDAKLIERGLEHARRMHARIGFPLYDVNQLIFLENKENANLGHSPEGTNLILAEGIKREYALLSVFSSDIAEAHVMGDIHLHGLGFIDRPYSSCQSLEYLKRFGLNLPHFPTVAKPAKHAEVLLAHMVRFSTTLQGNFAGVIAWDAVNFSFAPYLESMNDKLIRQFAQMLIYEFSQLTAARGGQSMFTDIHLYWDLPRHLERVSAIGPGGKILASTYCDYLVVARRFLLAILEVFHKGDARGLPFIFPRPLLHIGERFFQTPGYRDILKNACEVAAEKGNPCFVFDRGGMIRTSCGAMQADKGRTICGSGQDPWQWRCFAIHNVTVNLPRLGYKAAGNPDRLLSLVTGAMELAAKAHSQKRDFIEKLLSYGDAGPLAMLTMKNDGSPYLRMNQSVYLIGMTGLNELVQIQTRKELHHPEALQYGLELISHMHGEAERLGRVQGMQFLLEQTPAETTAYRFARLDLKYFSPEAGHIIKGNIASGEIYYTNSTHLAVSAPVSAKERARLEGLFHPFIKGGVMTNLWLGDSAPDPEKMVDLICHLFSDTTNDHVLFSPEFTTCNACGKVSRGRQKACPFCGAEELEGIARITQYFSRTSGWNKGKLAELRDRTRQPDATGL